MNHISVLNTEMNQFQHKRYDIRCTLGICYISSKYIEVGRKLKYFMDTSLTVFMYGMIIGQVSGLNVIKVQII